MAAKYQLIAKDLRNYILSYQSISAYKLPTEAELCEKYNVSRQTIRQSLLILENEKLIKRYQGSGSFIMPRAEYLRQLKIIMLVAEDSEYTYPGLISDINTVLKEQNLHMDVWCTKNDINVERSILEDLMTEHASILIVEGVHTSFPNPNIDLYERLQSHKTKILFIGPGYPELEQAPRVLIDEINGGYLLGKQMIMNNRNNIWAILPDYAQNARERFYGLQIAFREKDLPIPSQNIYWYSQRDIHFLYERRDTGFLTEFIRNASSQCNGVLCYNDEIAYWLLKELSYAKISVPEQISVASFDNSYLCTISHPPISSLSLPENEPGYSVGNMILDMLHEDRIITTKILPWKFISRGSI